MSNVLQRQHCPMETALDILPNIDKMFPRLSRQARFEATSDFMNLRQKKGHLVYEHMMKVITYLNELKILGAEIDAETKNHMVLNTHYLILLRQKYLP